MTFAGHPSIGTSFVCWPRAQYAIATLFAWKKRLDQFRSGLNIDRAWLDSQGMRILTDGEGEQFCVFVFSQTSEGVYSRMFAPEHGVPEDPATGSSTGPLAAFMIKHGLLTGPSNTRFTKRSIVATAFR